MGKYIGYIEKKGYEPNIFFNYKPFAEVRGENIFVLSPSEQEDLLPKSEKRNISLIYSWNNVHEREIMDEFFAEKSLAVFDFVLDDLQDNIKPTGDRNPTGYKVQAMELIDSGKICTLESLGIYYAVKKDDVLSNFSNDAIVEIDVPYVRTQNKVFIELDGFWAGAYNKYILKKYSKAGIDDYTPSNCVGAVIAMRDYTEIQMIESEFNRIISAYKIVSVKSILKNLKAIGVLQTEKDRLFKRIVLIKALGRQKCYCFRLKPEHNEIKYEAPKVKDDELLDIDNAFDDLAFDDLN